MPRAKIVNCKRCNRHIDVVGPLSARKLCEECGIAGVTDAVTAMYAGRGETYDKWLRNTTAGLAAAVARRRTVDGER